MIDHIVASHRTTIQVKEEIMARRVRKKRGSQSTPKKWKVKLLISCLVSSALAVVGLYLLATSYVTRNYLTGEIEKSYNCRFELEEVSISCLSPTATISLSGVKVTERDSLANDEVLHDERPKLTSALVELDQLTVKVSIFDLLFRNVEVKSLSLDGVRADGILYKDGTNNLEKLFVKIEDRDEGDEGETFNALSNSDFVTNLKQISLSNVELNLVVESSGLKIKARDVELKLNKDLQIDVGDLGASSPADFTLAAKIDFYSKRQDMHYGMIDFKGSVVGTIFDVDSADLDPNVELELKLTEKSHLKKIPVIEKTIDSLFGSDAFPLLKRFAAKEWPETYFWDKEQLLHCQYYQNRVTFLDPVTLQMGDWQAVLTESSWLESKDNSHEFNISLFASEAASVGAQKVFSYMPGLDGSGLFEEARLRLKIQTSGSLSDPKLKVVTDIGAIKKAGGDALKGIEEKLKGKLLDFLR